MSDMPNLPDDPRDCCRAALKIMGDDFDDAETLVRDMLDVIFSAVLDESLPAERVRGLLSRVQDAVAMLQADTGKVRKLVRHGAGDWRRLDAMLAVRAKALDEGRDPDAATREFEAQQVEGRA